MMKSTLALLAVAVLAVGAQGVTIDTVTVGNPGNAAEAVSGIGAVAYTFQISQQVTNNQYAEFLNAVAASDANELYNANMDSNALGGITRSGSDGSYTYAVKATMGDRPVVYVGTVDSFRFVNWLHNGQPTGAQTAATTEDGVYEMLDATTVANWASPRKVSNSYVLPSEDEWVKAGYYDPRLEAAGGPEGDDNYWQLGIQLDDVWGTTVATIDANGDCTNPSAITINGGSGVLNNVTTCGAPSYYGAYDISGNVYENLETLSDATTGVVRGGGCGDSAYWGTTQVNGDGSRSPVPITLEESVIGFRVAMVPEPATLTLLGLGAVVLKLRRKR